MDVDNRQTETPRAALEVTPKMLDFGFLSSKERVEGHGKDKITIRNVGTRVLVGEITLEVAWIESDIRDFRLDPGEELQVTFTVTKHMPSVWTNNRFGSDFIALVTGNGGTESVGGYYYLDPQKHGNRSGGTIYRNFWAFFLAAILLTGGSIFGMKRYIKEQNMLERTELVAEMYTAAAETISAEKTLRAPTATSSISSATNPDDFNATAAAIGAAMISDITGNEPTLTPWPAGKYPSPQQFLFNYYTLLNDRQFEDAFWLLSEKMQQNCCYVGDSTPIENYRALMDGVRSYELVSAFLQADNVNPAEVRMELITYYNDGTMKDNILTAYIIDDGERNTLLIDEIK